MKKLLMATGTAAIAVLLTNMAIAPAFADSLSKETSKETELETQYQVVLPEGEMMADAELEEVEGELLDIRIKICLKWGKWSSCK